MSEKYRKNEGGTSRIFAPLHNRSVSGDICNLSASKVSRMPLGTVAVVNVTCTDESGSRLSYPVMIARYSVFPYRQVLRVITEDRRFMMEALVYDQRVLRFSLDQAPFAGLLTDDSVILGYNLHTKVDGTHHPAFRARNFVPWAHQALRSVGVNQLLADFEGGSDTYAQFQEEMYRNGGNRVAAMEQSLAHPLYTALGYRMHPAVYHKQYPNQFVCALYTK